MSITTRPAGFSVQALDPRPQAPGGLQQPQLPQGGHAGGLQQKAGTDRAGLRGLLVDVDAVPGAPERDAERLPGGAVANDGDGERRTHVERERSPRVSSQAVGGKVSQGVR